jgi:hypothetical protein
MKQNERMNSIVNNAKVSREIDKKLTALLGDGFEFINGCIFLKSLYKNQGHIKENDFIDKTGFECFINSFHVDDYVDKDFISQGHLFLHKLFKKWNEYNGKPILKGILSETEYGANIKFHVVRENENWVDETNLNSFKEGIMILTSK